MDTRPIFARRGFAESLPSREEPLRLELRTAIANAPRYCETSMREVAVSVTDIFGIKGMVIVYG